MRIVERNQRIARRFWRAIAKQSFGSKQYAMTFRYYSSETDHD